MAHHTIRKSYVDCLDGQIHYYFQQGSNEIPIVCLHQTASSGRMFHALMRRLSGYTAYAIDTPGFGGSFDPSGKPSMADYAGWLITAIEGLGVNHCHLLGHHTGASIAAEIATTRPDMVASCMMIGPLPLTLQEREEFRKHFSKPFVPDTDGAYLNDTWEYLRENGADTSLDLHHREFVDTCRAYIGRYQAYSAVWDQDFTSLLRLIKAPLLLMCAPHDVLFDYFGMAQKIRPDAKTAELKGSNFEPDQDPDGAAQAIRTFLTNLV